MDKLQGICKYCLACNKLLDTEFKGIYRCDNAPKITKEMEQELLKEMRGKKCGEKATQNTMQKRQK